jgi:serine/threonine-protein kinase
MAMEYLDGKDLAEVLHALRSHRAALPPSLAALVAREVARALEHAHTATLAGGEPGGIVHRDVSPSNIMLLRSGGVKILDFGIAKAAALARPVDEGSGKHPKLQGHLGYVSPEQIRGTEVDRRSDLFSLGIVLWETLTGQHLFAGKDEFETMRNVLLRSVPPPSRRRQQIPAGLDAILARALDRDPARRYQTAAAMADDLDVFLDEMPCPEGAVTALLEQLFQDGPSDGLPDGPPVLPEAEAEAAASARPTGRRLVGAAVVAGTVALVALAGWLAGGGVRAERDQSSSARSVSTSR